MEERKGWKQLDVKTKIAYITAVVAFIIGWGLTIAGFIVGAGVISETVLWVLGQALVYAASIFGVGMYTTSAVKGMKKDISDYLHKQENGEV